MKNMLMLMMVGFSLNSYASLDCDDVVYMSRASTALSAEVSQLPRGLNTPEHEQHVLDIARKVVDEVVEVSDLPAADVRDADLNRILQIQELIAGADAAQVVSQLENRDLQFANSLRVRSMNNIRQLYLRCFEGQ